MKPHHLIFIFPLIILIDLFGYSWITDFMRQPSDAAVFAGVSLTGILITANYILFRYLARKLKP